MVKHVLSDGSEVASVEGFIVPPTAARLALEVLQRIEGGTHEEETKKSNLEGDHMGGGDNVGACGVCA